MVDGLLDIDHEAPMKLFDFKLTAEEAVLLDGRVNSEAQKIVDRAKNAIEVAAAGLSENEAAMVAKIIDFATYEGYLKFAPSMVRSCTCCGRSDGYHVVTRTTRYKRKGQLNYDAPKLFQAFNLKEVTSSNHMTIGFCVTCRSRVEAVLVPRLKKLWFDWPANWPAMAGTPQYSRHKLMECGACGWEGAEGELKSLGQFSTKHCPSCSYSNTIWSGDGKLKPKKGYVLRSVSSGIYFTFGQILEESERLLFRIEPPIGLDGSPEANVDL